MIDEKFFCFDLKENSTLYLIKGKYVKSIHSIEDCKFNEIPNTGLYMKKVLDLNNTVFPVIEIKKWLNIETSEKATSSVIISFNNKSYCLEINKIYGIFDLNKNKIFSNNGIKKIDFITYLEEKMVCSIDVKYLVENLNK